MSQPNAVSVQSSRSAALRDLTDPAQGPHAIQKVLDAAVRALAGAWRCELVLHRGSPVLPLADAPARLDAAPPEGVAVARAVVAPRDGGGTWHRLDVWRLRRGPALDVQALAEAIGIASRAVAPGFTLSAVAAADPHVVEGRQLDVRVRGEWTEIGRCGLVPPALLADLGLGEGASGLTLSLDLDRLVMLAKGIVDPALLRSEDARVARQMLDLSPYVPAALVGGPGAPIGPATLDEVRASIDRVDDRIVRLLSERRAYALLAARFKRSPEDVRAPAREEQVLAHVRALARDAGIEPDVVEGLYRHLMDEFVRLQRETYRAGAVAR